LPSFICDPSIERMIKIM